MTPEATKEIEQIKKWIETGKELRAVNDRLLELNWIFLHPYSQGMDIEILKRLLDGPNPEKKILNFFGKKFLNLISTLHFIEGFYKKRSFLKDFGQPIEESVILCIQRDYRGAISILIPVIEGTLRKFLISQEGSAWTGSTGKGMLQKSLSGLVDAYVELNKTYLRKRYEHLWSANRYFSDEEERQILEKHRELFQIWLEQLERYLIQNLYSDTRKGEPKDSFNRHLIYHALSDTIEFTLANYLRLYNCINFLCWAIGSITYESSVFSEVSEEIVFGKYKGYLKLLATSEAILATKRELLGRQSDDLSEVLPLNLRAVIKRPKAEITSALKAIDDINFQVEPGNERVKSAPNKLPKWLVGLIRFTIKS